MARKPTNSPPLTRQAETAPATFNEATRQVEATIASNARVRRRDSRGVYFEVLDPAGLDLNSAQGVSLLDTHNEGSIRALVGRVLSVRIEASAVIALLQFSTADDVKPVLDRIRDGTIRGLSIGYRILQSRTTARNGERIVTATRWQLVEASVVSNPADVNAAFRQKGKAMSEQDLSPTVTDGEDNPGTQHRSADPSPVEVRKEIRAMVRNADLDPGIADQLIDAGADLTRAKAEIFDHITGSRDKPIIQSVGNKSSEDPEIIRRRTSKALSVRMGVKLSEKDEDADAIRPLMALTLRDHATDSLTRAGESVRGLAVDDVFTRAGSLTTSDFPLVVANAATDVALASYRAAESPLKLLCRERLLPNFKDSTAVRLGEMGELQELAEDGEITHTDRAEAGEKMALKTFARMIQLSRKLLIDDDLNLFGDTVAALGTAAAQTEASQLAGLLNNNPNLRDGTAVFDATRDNVSTGMTLVSADLGMIRQKLRERKGLDGETPIDARPRFLLVPPAQETAAEKVVAEITPATVDTVNPFSGRLDILVEPRLLATYWYVFADPARLAGMQYAYLQSARGVQVRREESFNTLAMRFRAVLDFGVGWLDWRPAQRIEA